MEPNIEEYEIVCSDDEHYDFALICLNGHVINTSYVKNCTHNTDFCTSCGKKTIHRCLNCNKPIRGKYYIPGVSYQEDYLRKNNCHNCGRPYPWVESHIQSAEELADLLDGLDPDEIQELKNTFPHLINETPHSQLEAVKFHRLIEKTKNEAKPALYAIIYNLMTDGIKELYSQFTQ